MTRLKTRERIEEQADSLFYENGFEATSFADIADKVGISRGNFYHHFKSKDEILDAVINRRMIATQSMLDTWDMASSADRRIISFIRILVDNQTMIMAFGCPVGSLTTELAKLAHIGRDRAVEIFNLFRDWLAKQFRELGHGDEALPLALHLLGRSQGIAVMASAYKDEDFLRSEVAALEVWIKTLPNTTPMKG